MHDEAAEDQLLMLRFQESGDGVAFRALFARHKESLLAYLQRLAGRADVAEDVSQQAWLKLIEVARRRSYRSSEVASFRTWLFTLARNHFVDKYLRAHDVTRVSTLHVSHDETLPAIAAPPEDSAAARQMSSLLDVALRELPHDQRDVVALWSAGMDVDTIAAMVDAPRDTVISRKKYALTKLRAALARQGIQEA